MNSIESNRVSPSIVGAASYLCLVSYVNISTIVSPSLLALLKYGELAGEPVELISRFWNEEIAFLDLLARGIRVADFRVVQIFLHILAIFFGVPPGLFRGLDDSKLAR